MERKIIAAASLRFYDDVDDGHDEGTFTGRASTYGGTPDSYGDVVLRGAFDAAIKKNKTRPLLWQHDPAQPIGVVELRDTAAALMVEGRINLETQLGRDTYSNLKFGALDGLSIGFTTMKSYARKDGVREIAEVDLWEVSVVTFPANQGARIGDVKADADADDVGALALAAANLHFATASAATALHLGGSGRPAAKARPTTEPQPVDLHGRHAALYRAIDASMGRRIKDTNR